VRLRRDERKTRDETIETLFVINACISKDATIPRRDKGHEETFKWRCGDVKEEKALLAFMHAKAISDPWNKCSMIIAMVYLWKRHWTASEQMRITAGDKAHMLQLK
jgi:hypothetical protein